MPDIKIKRSDLDKGTAYRCFLLNVRSHRDYVCLEVDNCPSDLDFPPKEEFSIDSSQLVMPVLDKIRFNIKCANPSNQFWYKHKLEVFAEGNQLFPRKYCLKCEQLINEEKEKLEEEKLKKACQQKSIYSELGNLSRVDSSLKYLSPCGSEILPVNNAKNVPFKKKDVQFDKGVKYSGDLSADNIVNGKIIKSNLRSKSETLALDHEQIKQESSSLPDILIPYKESEEKCVQTQVSLGNGDLSDDSVTSITSLNNPSLEDILKSTPLKLKMNSIAEKDARFISSTAEKFQSFDINKKIRYWSLIKSARQMIKINRDVLELNSILKSLSVENCTTSNAIDSLSPVNLILKLKKLNRSSSLYNVLNDPIEVDTRALPKQWCENLHLSESQLNRLGYFFKLNKTFCLLEPEDSGMEGTGEQNRTREAESKESLLSINSFFSLQRRMLRMMEKYLKQSPGEIGQHSPPQTAP